MQRQSPASAGSLFVWSEQAVSQVLAIHQQPGHDCRDVLASSYASRSGRMLCYRLAGPFRMMDVNLDLWTHSSWACLATLRCCVVASSLFSRGCRAEQALAGNSQATWDSVHEHPSVAFIGSSASWTAEDGQAIIVLFSPWYGRYCPLHRKSQGKCW